MKRSVIPAQVFALVLTTTLILSACTARIVPDTQSTPTFDIAQQVTEVAATFISQVETQAAIPTGTATAAPASPTATLVTLPDFTQTALAIPTSNVTPSITPTANPYANDPCVDKVLPDVLTGEKIKIRIDSPGDKPINVSVYLQQSSTQSVCGYRAYILPANETLAINDLVVGCYTLWAWDPDPKTYFMVTNGTTCMDASKVWRFDIFPDRGIKLNK